MYDIDYPNLIRIKAFTSLQLESFPSSLVIKSFDVPINVDDIPLIIQKYPNVDHISIMYDKGVSSKLFTLYPMIKSITLVIDASETIPEDERFYINIQPNK